MRDKKRLTLHVTHRRGGPDTAHAIANIDLIETMRTRVSQTLGALSRPDTVHTHMQGRTGGRDVSSSSFFSRWHRGGTDSGADQPSLRRALHQSV
jgi:hypothetical protein